MPSPTTLYAQAVVAGEIIAGKPVRQACQRHLDDLEHGAARGLWFDEAAEQRAFAFIGMLCLSEGEFAGQPFTLQPFQQFIVGSLFGWKGSDGYRRFRKAYVEIGKGNGKSPMAAAIGLYGLVADGEEGAEIYSAATTRDQAGILWMDAKHMTEASKALERRVEVSVRNLAVVATHSYFRPVSSEARSLDGKRVHMALIDEVHEHPNALVIDKMQAGTKGRRQPLIFEITNSGYDRHSVCYQHHEYSLQILDGVLEDDGWFSYICALDDGDQWTDEAVWIKANPNIGVSVTWRYLREQVREAVGMPAKQNIVKRLNFCVWTEQAERWIDLAVWDACRRAIDWSTYVGKPCVGGLDLSSTTDLSAFVLLFANDDGSVAVLPHFWLPEDSLTVRVLRDRVPYDVWERAKLLTLTPGNVIDYDFIRAKINDFAALYRIGRTGFDPYNATQIVTQLQGDGLDCVAVRQGFLSLNAPTKELEKRIMGKTLIHDGNPILRWMISNVAVESDAAANVKPSKDKSREKIDGVSALVDAMDQLIRAPIEKKSTYEDHGLLVL